MTLRNRFLYPVLVLAVLLSALLGVLLVMRDTGTFFFSPKPDPASPDNVPPVLQMTAGTDETDDEEDAAAAVSSAEEPVTAREYADEETEEKTVVEITFVDAVLSERLSGYRILLLKGHDNPDGEVVAETNTAPIGMATFLVPDGVYTLVWDIPGYVEDYDNLTVGQGNERQEYYRDSRTDYVFWKCVIPCMQENGRYIVMEWKSADDLDLCMFNAHTKEFVSVISPMDSEGNFLYADDDSGSPGMEIIRIENAESSVVLAPYVRDGKSLQRGSYSSMESAGVRVSIYSGTELLSRQEADTAERAGLWNPCYIYEGRVYEEGAYIYDPGKYMWAAFEKPF